jgi:glycosyltransferase involved in cell wall biosynthesis
MTPKADRIPVKILFVGRFHPIKGLDILIEALALCDKEKFSVYIVADDKQISYYTNCIKKLVQKKCLNENIIFCGKIGEEDKLIEIYKECDIFVQPSLWDTSPITIVEAMCAGLPIVASNVGGIPEWVEDGVTGILVPEGNSLKLAKAIKSLLEDRNLRLMMGSRGYEKSLILRRWTWEKACAEYREAIAGFLTGC